jgi:hypothetical protein
MEWSDTNDRYRRKLSKNNCYTNPKSKRYLASTLLCTSLGLSLAHQRTDIVRLRRLNPRRFCLIFDFKLVLNQV